MSHFGPRSPRVTPSQADPPPTSTTPDQFSTVPLPALRVADSELVVAKSWLLGCGIAQLASELGGRTRLIRHDWSESLLEGCDTGDIDLAIFNREAALRFCEAHPDHGIWVSPAIARSMGGRNFSMIVSSTNAFLGMTVAELRQCLADVTIYVGKETDRYRNLLSVLGADDDRWFGARRIRIADIPDPRLAILDTDPSAILVPGQNRRYEARLDNAYAELLSYESLEPEVCEELRRRSENSLVFGREYDLGYGDPEDLVKELKSRFRLNTSSDESVNRLVEDLVDECEFAIRSRDDRRAITRHVLYETYRLGDPPW